MKAQQIMKFEINLDRNDILGLLRGRYPTIDFDNSKITAFASGISLDTVSSLRVISRETTQDMKQAADPQGQVSLHTKFNPPGHADGY